MSCFATCVTYQRPQQTPIRPIRTLWELDGHSCTTCGEDGDTEWTCPALIEEYNDLAGNPIKTQSYVVEGDGGTGNIKKTICCVNARFHSPYHRGLYRYVPPPRAVEYPRCRPPLAFVIPFFSGFRFAVSSSYTTCFPLSSLSLSRVPHPLHLSVQSLRRRTQTRDCVRPSGREHIRNRAHDRVHLLCE